VGADRGQPEPPFWLPPEDAGPDAHAPRPEWRAPAHASGPDARAPGREWYPGTEWYPGREYRPPRYGETRYRGPVHVPAGEYSSRQQEHRETEYRDEHRPRGRHSIPGPSFPGPSPARRRRPRRRHQVRNGMLVGLGCLSVIVAVGTGLTGEKFPASSPRSQAGTSTGQPAAAAPAAARPRSKSKPKSRSAGNGPQPVLTYRVTGTPGARVTYGPAGTYLTGRAPLQAVARLGNPLYYFISAELPGRGSVECEILIGTKVMDKSVATGRHSLASCQISRDPLSGKWQDAAGG
jgi:hypothetical protein